MTEDEAKTKVCKRFMVQESLGVYDGSPGIWSGTYVELRINCIASACMRWREDITREEAQNGYPAANGHCGLGGRP